MQFTVLLVALFALFATLVVADPTMPSFPDQYVANVTSSTSQGNVSVVMYVDVPNGLLREDIPSAHVEDIIVTSAGVQTSYTILAAYNICTKSASPVPPTQAPGACQTPVYNGNSNGLDSWTINCGTTVTTYFWNGQSPVEISSKVVATGETSSVYYSNVVLGQPPSSAFTIPAICSKSTGKRVSFITAAVLKRTRETILSLTAY